MGESERTSRKLNSWFWFLMYILPIIVMVFAIWKTQNTITIENISEYVDAFLNVNIIPKANTVKQGFLSIFEQVFGESPYLSAIVSMGLYMCAVKIMHLFVDLIMLIPNVAVMFCNRATGGKNV